MYESLFEDEDNIFGGTPQSKFFDTLKVGNQNLVKDEIHRIIERQAAMEILLTEKFGESDVWDKLLATNDYTRASEVDEKTKSLYIEYMGNIISRNE